MACREFAHWISGSGVPKSEVSGHALVARNRRSPWRAPSSKEPPITLDNLVARNLVAIHLVARNRRSPWRAPSSKEGEHLAGEP